LILIPYLIELHKSKQCIVPHPYTSSTNYKQYFIVINALHILVHDNPFNLPDVATLLRGSVRMKLTFPKLGLGIPSRLLKLQSSIAGVKTPCIGAFFISLEN